jgi:hypothetical protein
VAQYRQHAAGRRLAAHLVGAGVGVVEEGDVLHLLLQLVELARQQLSASAVACSLRPRPLEHQPLSDLQQWQGRAARWCQHEPSHGI